VDKNPYSSPREHGYVTPEHQAWWAWLKDRLLLWGCGWAIFFAGWGLLMAAIGIAWLLGFAN
jgi:hypothetical protein